MMSLARSRKPGAERAESAMASISRGPPTSAAVVTSTSTMAARASPRLTSRLSYQERCGRPSMSSRQRTSAPIAPEVT